MIIPSKHTNLSESIIGLAGFLLSFLTNSAYSIDELWGKIQQTEEGHTYFRNHSFDNVVIAIDLLYMMGVINMNDQGKIEKL